MNRFGQIVWRELRGLHAGAPVPQFSIHRGRLQGVIRDAVVERLGPDAIRTGRRLQGFLQDEGGVTAHFADARLGEGGETARADDGLALSSRNGYLSAEERAEAVHLSRELKALAATVLGGEHNLAAVEQRAMQTLQARGWAPDYLTVRRRHDLQPPEAGEFRPGELVALGAAKLGRTRLIDNLEF